LICLVPADVCGKHRQIRFLKRLPDKDAIGRRFGRHDGQQYFELFRAKLLQRIGEGKQRVEGECVGRQRDD